MRAHVFVSGFVPRKYLQKPMLKFARAGELYTS